MTTVTITASNFCPSNGHCTIAVTGAKTMTLTGVETAQFADPITEDDALSFTKAIVKMARSGRTAGQAKALLEAGVTITV